MRRAGDTAFSRRVCFHREESPALAIRAHGVTRNVATFESARDEDDSRPRCETASVGTPARSLRCFSFKYFLLLCSNCAMLLKNFLRVEPRLLQTMQLNIKK